MPGKRPQTGTGSMYERVVQSIRNVPFALARALTALGLAVAILLLALWVHSMRAEHALAAQISTTKESLTLTELVEQAEVDDLQAQLAVADERLLTLERGLAGGENPFDFFAEVFDLARQGGLAVISVQRDTVVTEDYAVGTLRVERYTVRAEGKLAEFVRFAEDLEAVAPGSVTLDNIVVDEEERACTFEVIVVRAS